VVGALHAILRRPDHECGTVKGPQPLADLEHLAAAGAGRVLAQVASYAPLGLQRPQPAVDQLVGQRALGHPAKGDRKATQGAQAHRLHRQEDAARDHRGQPQVLARQPGRVVLKRFARRDHQPSDPLVVLACQHERGGVVVLNQRHVAQLEALEQLGDDSAEAR